MRDNLHKNFLFLAVSNVLAPLFSMVLVLAISRVQGVEILGKYSFMMTVLIVGQTVAGFGLPIVITREVAPVHARAGAYFLNASLISVVLIAPVLAVSAVMLHGWTSDGQLRIGLFLTLLALLPSSVTQAGEAVLLAFERASDFVMINMGETIVRACVGCALVLSGYGIVAIAATILGLRVAAAMAFVLALHRRDVDIPRRVDRGLCRRLIREVPILGAIPVVNSMYARADVFLLSSLGSWRAVGLYTAALRLVDLARTIGQAYARSLYPVLSRLRSETPDAYGAMARRSLRTVALLVAPGTLVLFGLASLLMVHLFGPQLEPAAVVLRILAWTLVPLALAVTLAQMLFSANRQVIDLRVNIIATIATVVANMLVIPRWGEIGVAFVSLGVTTLYATLQYVWVKQHVADPMSLGLLGKLLLLALMGTGVMLVLRGAGELIAFLVGSGVYGLGLLATGLVTVEELRGASSAVIGRFVFRGRRARGLQRRSSPTL